MIINKMKGLNEGMRSPGNNTTLTLPRSAPISDIRACPASPSSWTALTLRIPKDIKAHRAVKEMANHVVETHTRVSLKAANPWFDEMPSVDNVEHAECSNAIKGSLLSKP